MSRIDWSGVETVRKPTKREVALYRNWKKYLTNSRLSPQEVSNRAKAFAEQHKPVPKD